ncbi:hypothetical protein CDCA_CDCA16G4115 [Cyanidium caldarium]|uniref:Arsenite methyltransferase n=1 Tax=Cyanidium caldarium TaxID=2771 RepID=A0AAV9J199_CYACA|nr:hypothetical protein CDCA_CDCA16G4115 [Cyanidium caldarium]
MSPCECKSPCGEKRDNNDVVAGVAEYYSQTLKTSADLKTTACCPAEAMPASHRAVLAEVADEVQAKFYGCGSPIPGDRSIAGLTVLDLGCGTGRDVFLASKLVGESGRVIGVDMLESQLEVARRYVGYHAEKFFGDASRSNVQFLKGYIEDLRSTEPVGVADASVDLVVSNCVCNLSPDKARVFAEVYRVLRAGGEFYFSDIYCDRQLSEAARQDKVLYGECLGGALCLEDFQRLIREAGFSDVRLVHSAPVEVEDARLRELVEGVRYFSCTFRCFKAGGGRSNGKDSTGEE